MSTLEPNPKRYRTTKAFELSSASSNETSFISLRDSLEDLFNQHPVEHWTPWGLPRGAIRGAIPPGVFSSLPEGLVFDIASYLAPHELGYFFLSDKAMYQTSKTDSGYKLRLTSCIRYFAILKVYADSVRTSVVGGWQVAVMVLTKLAHKLQILYSGFEVHKLHRCLIVEQLIGTVCNFQGLLPFHPNHLNIDQTDDTGRYEPDRGSQPLGIERAFLEYDNDEHLPRIHYGDISMEAMWDVGRLPPECSNIDDTIHPNEIDRVKRQLLPMILIYREEEDGNEVGIGFGGPADQNQLRVCQWEADYDDDDEPTWLSGLHNTAEFPASIVATYCMDMHQERTSQGFYRKYIRELAWLWAHRVAPIDDQDSVHWVLTLRKEEQRIRTENLTEFGTEDPFDQKTEDDALFAYACDVVGGGNRNYNIASPNEYLR